MVFTLPRKELSGGKTLAEMGGVITQRLPHDTFSFEAYAMGAYGNTPVVFTHPHPVGYSIGPATSKAVDAAIKARQERWEDMKRQHPGLAALESNDMEAAAAKERRNAQARERRRLLKIYKGHIQRGGLIGIGAPGFKIN